MVIKKKIAKAVNKGSRRPTLITVLCIIGFVGIFLSFAISIIGLVLFEKYSQIPEVQVIPLWSIYYSLLAVLIELVLYLFIWRMKKWALFAFTAMFFVNWTANYVAMGASVLLGYGLFSIIGSAIFLGLFYIRYKDFR